MVRPPTVPHNTPLRSNSRVSNLSGGRPETTKHQEKLRKRLSPASDNSKNLEALNASNSKDINEIHCSCERLNNELFQFVGDFIDSQEYRDYLDFKRSVHRKDEAVQYDAMDIVKDGAGGNSPTKTKKVNGLRALSQKALRVFFLEVQIEKYLDNMKNAQILNRQDEAINTIRQKIEEVKCAFLCHREELLNRKKEREQTLVKRFINRHNIDISKIISTNRLDKVILDIERKLRMKKRSHKNNIKIIVEKLLKEYFHNKNEGKKMKRLYLKKKNSVNEDMVTHIKGKRGSQYIISSVHLLRREDPARKAFREAGLCIKDSKFEIPGRLDLWDQSGATGLSYCKSDKTIQEGLVKDISSQISQEDNMYKMKLNENAKYKLGVMESFVQFEDLLEARHFFCTCERERTDKEKADVNYPDDSSIISNPDKIIFKDFNPGKTYTKNLTLRNRTGHPVRIRFFKIYCEDPKYTINFEVDLNEIKIARPGLPVNMNVKFQPTTNTDLILGTMVFLTCCGSTYCRHMIPIECFPTNSDLTIEPRSVNFGTIPIWKFTRNPPVICRSAKLRSRGKKTFKLVINKVLDPFELDTEDPTDYVPVESSSSSDESLVEVGKPKKTSIIVEMEGIINEILMEVDNIFRFDRKYLVMDSQHKEESLKISLSMIRNPGFYFEKYRVDIYDVRPDADEYQGMQEIMITLEVPDHFIRCEPVCVDLGICFYGTAYQSSFGIVNTSRTTQSVSVRIPSSLSYYVSLDENCIFIKSGEIRRVTVKLIPSLDFMLEKSKYFDQATYILYFPVEVRLVDKKYACIPPIMEHCYAIINDCSDLTLNPDRDHYEDVDGRMVLDMGECSVSETVTTQIVLRNSSYSRRYYGFTNLPQWITIMPNYGYGCINSFQELKLNILIHPLVKDFKDPSGSTQNDFREDKHLTISVETVANLGKYRRKPNMNRLLKLMRLMLAEMKRTMDIDLLEDIFIAKSYIRTNVDLCACESAIRSRRTSPASTLLKQVEPTGSNTNESYTMVSSKLAEDKDEIQTTKHQKKEKDRSQKHHNDADVFKKSETIITLLDDEAPNELPLTENSPMNLANNLVNSAENLSRELRLKMVFVRPLYEFSFNHIEFPVTPGGSYSLMTTELRPLKFEGQGCPCNSGKELRNPRCRSTFRISGSTQEMKIEPMYGVLEHGQSIKLTLISTPKISDDVIAAYAYEGKKNAQYDAKMEEELRRRAEAFARQKRKSKTKITVNKKKRKKERNISIEIETSRDVKEEEEEDIKIEISPEEVQLEYSDFYPAELALWRSIEPYFLNTNFVCRLDYEMDDPWFHSPDIFSLEAVCKVVGPDFIHDQKTQHLDFGQVPIGDHERKIITIQNLKYHDINVTTSILRPDGGFFCPNFDCVKLPSECFLKIPITYTPDRDESVLEYMEVRAERTVYHFMLSAKAAVPNIRLEPSSKIIRIVSRRGKLSEIFFEIVNDSRQPVRVSLEKVCELEGKMVRQSSRSKSMGKSNRMVRKKAEMKENSGKIYKTSDLSPKKNSRLSFSDELTEEEMYSIENDFSSTTETSYFQLSEEAKELRLQESSKTVVKILFGPKTSMENPKSLKGRDRRKSITEVTDGDVGKMFVAKYNLLIGSSYFLRDFIILGEVK